MSEHRVERVEVERSLEQLVSSTELSAREGLFGPRSFAWRMFRERALVTYAPRAVMLQYAYPPFAAASASYGVSATPGVRFERAVSTLLEMIFGERDRVIRDARRLHLMHDRLHGALDDGTPYHGNDRASLVWVLVTLLDASVRGYERHVARVDERALFTDVARFAALFGLAPHEVPRTRHELDAAVDDAKLVVGEETRAMWRFLGSRTRSWAAATLPSILRERLEPQMSERRAHAIERAGSALRAALVPERWRYVDAYVEARRRIRA